MCRGDGAIGMQRPRDKGGDLRSGGIDRAVRALQPGSDRGPREGQLRSVSGEERHTWVQRADGGVGEVAGCVHRQQRDPHGLALRQPHRLHDQVGQSPMQPHALQHGHGRRATQLKSSRNICFSCYVCALSPPHIYIFYYCLKRNRRGERIF